VEAFSSASIRYFIATTHRARPSDLATIAYRALHLRGVAACCHSRVTTRVGRQLAPRSVITSLETRSRQILRGWRRNASISPDSWYVSACAIN